MISMTNSPGRRLKDERGAFDVVKLAVEDGEQHPFEALGFSHAPRSGPFGGPGPLRRPVMGSEGKVMMGRRNDVNDPPRLRFPPSVGAKGAPEGGLPIKTHYHDRIKLQGGRGSWQDGAPEDASGPWRLDRSALLCARGRYF
jgi:hypothetical protein